MSEPVSSALLFFGAIAAITVVVMGVVVYAAYRQGQAIAEAWGGLALRTGLLFEPRKLFYPPRLSGEFRRHPLLLTTYTVSHGKSSTTYTRITLTVGNPAANRLAITPAGPLDALGKALGMQDVQVGDAEFDRRFTVKSQPPEFAIGLLGDSFDLRDKVAKLKTGWFAMQLEGQTLTYREVGVITQADRLEILFNSLSDLADQIEGKKDSDVWSHH